MKGGRNGATWIYFATAAGASLEATLKLARTTGFLWRSLRNSEGALIANVGNISPGDHIIVAWRQPRRPRTAYLRCRVAQPLAPREANHVIDRLAGADARKFIDAGYRKAIPAKSRAFVSKRSRSASSKCEETTAGTTLFTVPWTETSKLPKQ